MNSLQHAHKIVLLATSFQQTNRHLFFPRARLYFDRIELSGWDFKKKFRACLPLDKIRTVDWNLDASDDANATIHMEDGQTFSLNLSNVKTWKQTLEQRFNWSTTSQYQRPLAVQSSNLSFKDQVVYAASLS